MRMGEGGEEGEGEGEGERESERMRTRGGLFIPVTKEPPAEKGN